MTPTDVLRTLSLLCLAADARGWQGYAVRGLRRPLAGPQPAFEPPTSREVSRIRCKNTKLYASNGNDGVKAAGAAVLLAAVLGASVLPAIQTASVMSKVEVVRNEEAGTSEIKLKPKFAKLSPLTINKKLAQIPVFYAADPGTGGPMTGANNVAKFFLDPADAEKMVKSTGKGKVVVATLDEVYYPLVAKRGVFGYKSPLLDKTEGDASYELVGNAEALTKAKEFGYDSSDANGIPIFQADKLAFQSPDGRGVIIPVFLSAKDLQDSWDRLRDKGGSVAEKPSVTANNLQEVVAAMEGGEQDYSKIEFFPDLPALERARDMLE